MLRITPVGMTGWSLGVLNGRSVYVPALYPRRSPGFEGFADFLVYPDAAPGLAAHRAVVRVARYVVALANRPCRLGVEAKRQLLGPVEPGPGLGQQARLQPGLDRRQMGQVESFRSGARCHLGRVGGARVVITETHAVGVHATAVVQQHVCAGT